MNNKDSELSSIRISFFLVVTPFTLKRNLELDIQYI